MDSNYFWQKQQAQQRIQQRLDAADAHRMLAKDTRERKFTIGRFWNKFSSIFRRKSRSQTSAAQRIPRFRRRRLG